MFFTCLASRAQNRNRAFSGLARLSSRSWGFKYGSRLWRTCCDEDYDHVWDPTLPKFAAEDKCSSFVDLSCFLDFNLPLEIELAHR